MLACTPPSLLEFRWGTDVIRLEVEPRDGGCTLTLLDTTDGEPAPGHGRGSSLTARFK